MPLNLHKNHQFFQPKRVSKEVYSELLKQEKICIIKTGLDHKKLNTPFKEILKERKEDKQKDLILYPFVFPGKRKWNVPHIVLVAIDFKKQEILYYDSQGLSSDDPSRLKVFEENKKFNMRKNLEKLGTILFKDKFTIKENRVKNQKDPHNCGVFVLSMMDFLSKGIDFEAAIQKCSKTHVSTLRNNLGTNYIDFYVQKRIKLEKEEQLKPTPLNYDMGNF